MSVHVLGEVSIGDLDAFLRIFESEGLDKRAEHGCLGAEVYRPAGADNAVVVLLEWPDEAAFEGFRRDPTAPPIMRRGGAQGPPTFTVLERVASLEH